MVDNIKIDICIIGAGSGGLSVAAVAAQLGLRAVLIERADMGGDCLNTGCVPSKALLAAAKRAQMHRMDDIKGIKAHDPEIDFGAVKDHVFDTIKAIAPHDSQMRFERLGVRVIREGARFAGPNTLQAGEHVVKARYFVIATGSRPVMPSLPGLDKSRALTNETIFALREKPRRLLIIGGGPVGIEMAQAHRRLGCEVCVFDMGPILPRDDHGNVAVLRQTLIGEGVELHERVVIEGVKHTASGINLVVKRDGKSVEHEGSHLLVAAGRAPNTIGLDLEKAGVAYDHRGIIVDAHLRTTNRRIFAIGDVCGGPQFTHVASYHAGIVIRQICFRMFWTKVDYKGLPWVTYTDPELAQVGLTEVEARTRYCGRVKVVEWGFDENDRAVAECATGGQIRVVTDVKGLILGASIVGPHAGELIGLWGLAIANGMKIGAIAAMIAPYPTLGEVSKRVAGDWYSPKLFSERSRRVVRLLQKLPLNGM